MRSSPTSLLFTWSLVAASFILVACGGSVVEGNPENTDGGVGGANAGQGGAPGSGGLPYTGGSAGSPYVGGSAGYPYTGGSAGWPAGGSAGWPAGGSAGWPAGGSAGWPAGGSAGWPQGGSAGAAGGALYGMIDSIAYKTPFLLDADKLGDDAYVQQHYDAILFDAGFYGWYSYKKVSIPAPQATQTVTYAMHQAATGGQQPGVLVTQYSVGGGGQDIIDPYVYLAFASDKIQPGTYTIGLDANAGVYLVLYHMLNGGSDYCAAAVAFGQLNVIAAENTSAPDGGTLAIGGQAIQLYHPTNTPIGDVSGWVGSICPIQ